MGRLHWILVAVVLVVLAGCGGDDGETATSDSTTTAEPTTTTTAATTTTTEPDQGPLPGERVEIFPYEGAELGVVGVEADDTLNVRSGPGVAFDVVLELEPLATDVIATGHNRSLDGEGFWSEITVEGRTGWANSAFLAHLGQVTDITGDVAPTPADRPRADTMRQLGETVAATMATDDPPSTITVVDGPTVGDVGEVTVDVIGLGDDSVRGVRLVIVAEPDDGGESFTLRSVEETLLCARGVTDDGICI